MNDRLILLVSGLPAFFASNGLPNLDGSWLLQALVFISCGLVIWNQGKAALGKNKPPLPQPLLVEQLKAMATAEDVKELHRELKDEMREMRKEMTDEDDKLHRRTGAVSTKLADLDGGMKEIKNMVRILIKKEIG